jgi:hypothetical protein
VTTIAGRGGAASGSAGGGMADAAAMGVCGSTGIVDAASDAAGAASLTGATQAVGTDTCAFVKRGGGVGA